MLRDIERYLERCALDEVANQPSAKPTTLAEHDAQYHPDGFKEGDSCKFREERAKGDWVDKVEKRGGGGRRTGSASLSAADRAALNGFHRRLLKEPRLKNLYLNAYNSWSGDKKYCTDRVPTSLPDEVLRWCEDKLAAAIGNMDKLDRAKIDLADDNDCESLIGVQAARDLLDNDGASERMKRFAQSWIERYKEKRLFVRSRMEAEGTWTEDPNDKPKLNAARLESIKKRFDSGLELWEDSAYDKDRKEEIFKTLDNAPYEFIRNVYLTKSEFHFINGDEGYNDDDGEITIGFGKWSFNGETVAHECGHSVLYNRGQKAKQEVLPEFEPIVDALAEDYNALELPEFGPAMHNDNISSSNEYQKTRNEVKRISLLRTMDEPDFDAMVDANGEAVLDVSDDEIHEYATIADTLCAATNGVLFCGHSRQYYQNGAAFPLHETVANATAALVMEWKTFPKVFPRTFAAVKRIVYGIND